MPLNYRDMLSISRKNCMKTTLVFFGFLVFSKLRLGNIFQSFLLSFLDIGSNARIIISSPPIYEFPKKVHILRLLHGPDVAISSSGVGSLGLCLKIFLMPRGAFVPQGIFISGNPSCKRHIHHWVCIYYLLDKTRKLSIRVL